MSEHMAFDAKLVMMANQIGQFFTPQRRGDAVSDIATHIRKFWDPRMRAAIYAHLDHGGTGLDEPVRQAVARLKEAEAHRQAKSPGEVVGSAHGAIVR